MIPQDQWHSQALRASKQDATLITSAPVVSETVSLLQIQGFFSLALEFLGMVTSGAEIRIVYPDESLQAAAWDEFRKAGSFGASAVDCMSFAIMRRHRIRRAWTFDTHFATAGFETLARPVRTG